MRTQESGGDGSRWASYRLQSPVWAVLAPSFWTKVAASALMWVQTGLLRAGLVNTRPGQLHRALSWFGALCCHLMKNNS